MGSRHRGCELSVKIFTMSKKKKRKKQETVKAVPKGPEFNPFNPPLLPFLLVLLFQALVFDPKSLDPAAPKELILAISLSLFGLLAMSLYKRGRKLCLTAIDKLFLVTMVATALSEYFRQAKGCGPLWPKLLLLLFLYATARILFSAMEGLTICRYLGAFFATVALLNLVLHFFYPLDWHNTVTIGAATVDAKAPGLVGTFANPNYLAGYLLMGVPLLLGVFAISRPADDEHEPTLLEDRVFIGMALLLLFIGLALTWCRSVWLTAALVAPLAIFIGRRKLEAALGKRARKAQERWAKTWPRLVALALITIVPLVALGFAAGGGWKILSTSTLAKRMRIAQVALVELREQPIFGWGAGRFEGVYSKHRPKNWRETKYPVSTRYTHNLLTQAWGALGIAGLIILTLLLVQLLKAFGEGFWQRHEHEEGSVTFANRQGRGLLALAALAFLLDNFFNVTLFVSSTSSLFIVILAALSATHEGDYHIASLGRLIIGAAVVGLVALMPRLYDDWQIGKMMAEARQGCPPERLSKLRAATKKRPQWVRFSYDVAGRLAKARRFEEALDLYEKVDKQVPGYQEVRTNMATIKQFLSQRRF